MTIRRRDHAQGVDQSGDQQPQCCPINTFLCESFRQGSMFLVSFSFCFLVGSPQIWLCHAVAIPCALQPSYSHLRGVQFLDR